MFLREEGGVACLKIAGDVTSSLLPDLEASLSAILGDGVYSRKIAIDFSDSAFVDTSGISWLLAVTKRCKVAGGKLAIHSIPPMVRNVLDLLRMDLVLNIGKDQAEAVQIVEMN